MAIEAMLAEQIPTLDLNCNQFTRANAARERVNDQRSGDVRIVHLESVPNPEMSKTYYL